MSLNRKLAPQAKEITHIDLIHPHRKHLENGIPVFEFNAGEQDLIRIEWVFSQSNWEMSAPLSGYATHQLLTAGTQKYTAKQITEMVDYYGAFLQTDFALEKVTVTLFTLNKYLPEVLPVVKDCLKQSIFPSNEVKIFADTQQQQLAVALEKNDVIARRKFSNLLFGNTPYGYESQFSDYQKLSQEALQQHYTKVYQPNNCEIFVAGKVEDDTLSLLNKYFGNWEKASAIQKQEYHFKAPVAQEVFIEKSKSVQSAIRLGKFSINRSHPDFAGLQFVNCILGGYFGSRLMSNIREDKGFTYGIGSGLVSLQNAGYLFIATEVGVDVCADTIKEIHFELDRLQTEKVSDSEIELVRNYLLGSFLGGLENAFSHADKFKNIHFYGLDYSYYEQYIQTIRTLNSDEILHLSQKYLNSDGMNSVIVGKK